MGKPRIIGSPKPVERIKDRPVKRLWKRRKKGGKAD